MAQSNYNISQRKYYGKLLLFGEYGIILDSMGLAIPFHQFSGYLSYANNNKSSAKKSHEILKSFGNFIQENKIGQFNESLFFNDIQKGVYFQSNIPQGYGAGSSGALVATFYERYFKQSNNKNELKNELAALEDFFHGKSSGYDPLVSFLDKTIIINEDKSYKELNFKIPNSEFHIFLIDSGLERETKGFVNRFIKNQENINYRDRFKKEYINPTNNAIRAITSNDTKSFFESLKEISNYQFTNWQSLIPQMLIPHFEKSLQSDDFTMKLCGAGGGGYFLGFSKNFEKAKNYFDSFDIAISKIQ